MSYITEVNQSGIRTVTTTSTGDSVVSNTIPYYLEPYTTVQGFVDLNYITQEEHEKEIKKRDDKIRELEDKLESLTKQVASILEGNKEVIDDNITTEQLKKMFD